MGKIVRLLFLIFFTCRAFAQDEPSIWYFGQNAGLSFSSGAPVPLTDGQINTFEGCAIVSNKTGFLFYTDGSSIWNRNHTKMPNGTGLLGNWSTTQASVIVPQPGKINKYYVFTVMNNGLPGGVNYSEVDMSLDNGMGDVVTATKNTPLFTPSTEKITAVKHANGIYFWIIAHATNSNRYYEYLVDCNGVNPPIITDIGRVHKQVDGYLVASPDAKKLAVGISYFGIELLDFDNLTGTISNPLYLDSNRYYGVAFSPNSNVLYASILSVGYMQWNLQAGSAAAIIASGTKIGSTFYGGALKVAPDKKLYIAENGRGALSVINDPNVVGAGCNLQYNTVSLGGRVSGIGLPQTFFHDPIIIKYENTCFGTATQFSISGGSGSLDSVRWSFGDPASGSADSSRSYTPTHVFTAIDTYSVRLIRYFKCVTDTSYANVIVSQIPQVHLNNDTLVCGAGSVILKSSNTYSNISYLWSTGETTASITATKTGTYWLKVTDNGCSATDTVALNIISDLAIHLKDTNVCTTDMPIVFHTPPVTLPGIKYLWSTGSTDDSIIMTQPGRYWLQVTWEACTVRDTMDLTTTVPPTISLGADTAICEGTQLSIGTIVTGATYKWNNDSTSSHITVSKTGDYIITVALGPCIAKDTIKIEAIPNPVVDLGPDSSMCEDAKIILDAGTAGIRYLWNSGNTKRTDTAAGAGTYWVQVSSEYNCVGSDTIVFTIRPLPYVTLGNDTTICEDVELKVQPVYTIHEDGLSWSTGSTDRQIYVKDPGLYIVTASNDCGVVKDTIRIRQIFCDVRVPNAFTPDGDGVNDIFRVIGNIEHLQNFGMRVYNRWGELLYTGYDKYSGWDGKQKGSDCTEGVYVYVISYTLKGEDVFMKGNVTLLR